MQQISKRNKVLLFKHANNKNLYFSRFMDKSNGVHALYTAEMVSIL